uniref:Uncharacterized protein n=1 Tax=Rhizophagus irregularis (strain DAOM 181602 / DAOM 197198 / MUCL 43194) TaxID=747089 RepID=U9U9Q2_RHIID
MRDLFDHDDIKNITIKVLFRFQKGVVLQYHVSWCDFPDFLINMVVAAYQEHLHRTSYLNIQLDGPGLWRICRKVVTLYRNLPSQLLKMVLISRIVSKRGLRI